MKKWLIILFFVPLASQGQQQGIYSQYIFNLFTVNPAYAGELDALATSLSYRAQWVGFEGAPNSQYFTAHTPLPKKNMALGIQIQNDEIGARQTPSFAIAYAYKLNLGKNRRISFGLQGGVVNYQYNWNELQYNRPQDPVAYESASNKWIPNFDFGVMYLDPQNYFGVTLKSINQAKTISSDFSDASLSTLLYIVGGRTMPLSEKVSLKPSFIAMKSLETPFQFDVNIGALYDNRFWLTATYRYQFGMVFSGQFYINDQFHFGYSYDLATNGLMGQQGGTHEIFIGYEFNIYKTPASKSRQY